MAMADTTPSLRRLANERRRFQRVKVNLLGRYMLEDRSEFPCQVVNMSPGGMALVAPVSGRERERVVAYIDHVGRLEGAVTRLFPNGFAMSFAATARKRDKLAAQLTWLANRDLLDSPEDRRHGRFVPRDPFTSLLLPSGLAVGCRIIDASLSGAAVATDHRPPVGALVSLGKVQARVVRHLDEGFAVEFTRLQHPDYIEKNLAGD
jgi:hypothetical protein